MKKTTRVARVTATEPADATFAASEAGPIDAPMWPLCAPSWLQPEIPPAIPAWTGLAIERHFGIPAPEFLDFENAALNRPATLILSDEIHPPALPRIPESGLAPLGRDPRAVCRQQGRV